MNDLGRHMAEVAKLVWGEPNAAMSSKKELRWGSHGSRSVDIGKGTWFDHETKAGGGVLDFLEREKGLRNGAQFDWLKANGFDLEEQPRREGKRIVATYDYHDDAGETIFQVVRFEPKSFLQRRQATPDDPPDKIRDGWVWSVRGVRLVPYRLPELQAALAFDRPVLIVEGEKDVENLAKLGIVATCNPMGAGKWPQHFPEFFVGADVIIVPDNDEAGRAHRDLVGSSLDGTAASVRVLELPGLKPKGDISDWLAAGGTAEALNALIETRAKRWGAGPPESRFGAIQFCDIDTISSKHDWLVNGLLHRHDMSMTFGRPKCGKSFFSVDLALSIARGADFFGRPVRQGAVIYQAGEGGKGLVGRLKAYRDYHAATGADLPFILLTKQVNLYLRDGDTDGLIAEIEAWRRTLPLPLELVVVDTLARASPGANENASEDMSLIISHCQRIQEVTNAHVMLVHHTNAAGDKPRGHTSLLAAVDTAIEITKDDFTGDRSARVTAQKDGEEGEVFGFRLQPVDVGSYDDGKPITSCVVVPAQELPRAGARSKDKRLTDDATIAIRCLEEALTDHGVAAPVTLGLPFGIRAVEYHFWRDVFMRRMSFDTGTSAGTIRSTIKRVGSELCRKGRMGRDGNWLWLVKSAPVAQALRPEKEQNATPATLDLEGL